MREENALARGAAVLERSVSMRGEKLGGLAEAFQQSPICSRGICLSYLWRWMAIYRRKQPHSEVMIDGSFLESVNFSATISPCILSFSTLYVN
ncbi:hypothetical protein HS088_TW19G00064 [Tripterygium wilfordii]|uniref:Uncharacterized protein n=1 Tax=Tripterygium wilfordii TaxID=458696 RepID=A0A7J7C8J6_TRIWF|nr:hypothetical protein HS088_TW19G00064 [Tripterygium wilfordii]